MPGFVREHLRPLAGATAFHVLLLGLFGAAAVRWTREQPPVQLAIEGVVVDSRDLPVEQAAPRVEAPTPSPDAEAEARAAEQQALRERQMAEQERTQRAERAATELRDAERRRMQELEERERAAAEARLKEEAEQREREAVEARRREAESREARQQAAREAELRRSLAAEEEAAAVARSGVVDDYRRLLIQTIERNWIRPPSARAGLECTVHVTQAPGGTVVDVRLGACNGDPAVQESIKNAVFRSSPLPPPRDARAFERRLEIVFKPLE
jgi:colicin import membrane protein